MAQYSGTFSCGHEGTVNVIGPTKDRQWKIDRKFGSLCDKCYKEQLEKEKERKNKEALEKSKEWELPELKGTEKQVVWAITLRQDFINKIEEKIQENEKEENLKIVEQYRLALDFMINAKITAKYYIDNRGENGKYLVKQLYKECKEDLETKEKEVEMEDIIQEGTVAPKEVKYPGIVHIEAIKDQVNAKYERNDKFREVVKNLNFKWVNTKWLKNISELTGSYIDRASELGNKLLNAGFTICILDEEIRNKAIAGDFEPECDRWIKINFKSDKLAIKWYDKNDYMYSAARKIKTSKWDSTTKSVLVDVSHYEEVQEFAKFYECKFTEKALGFIKQYKIELANILIVEPVRTKDKPKEDGLKNILKSSRDILDDLRDDDEND